MRCAVGHGRLEEGILAVQGRGGCQTEEQIKTCISNYFTNRIERKNSNIYIGEFDIDYKIKNKGE